MLSFLPGSVRAVLAFLLICINTLFWSLFLFAVTLVKLLVPVENIRKILSRWLVVIAEGWVAVNSFILWLTQKIHWDVRGLDDLRMDRSYLVVSNHRSWADILVLQHLLRGRIPFLKFFLKRELIWVPVLGVAWWALDFPFMKRYSREFLKKHPELQGKDMETTRRYCEKFKDSHVSVINFLEGTRYTDSKRDRQESPYQHLLRPKAGGVALVLSSMGDYLANVVDVTIGYPENGNPLPFSALLKGEISRIVVRVRVLPVPQNVVGRDYQQDEEYKAAIQQWVNDLWNDKEAIMEAILK